MSSSEDHVWTMTDLRWQRCKLLRKSDFENPELMDYRLVLLLDAIFHQARLSPDTHPITSDWRDDNPMDPSEHFYGKAVDISCTTSDARHALVSSAISQGVTRIGVYPKHIHLGIGSPPQFPTRVLWIGDYTS